MSALQFPAARQPVITTDAQSGVPTFTRPWFLFFEALYSRAGGTSGPTVTQIQLESDAGLNVEELQSVTNQSLSDLSLQTSPPLDALQLLMQIAADADALRIEVGALREIVAEMQKSVQDLSQSTLL